MTIFSIREAAPEDAVPLTDLLNSLFQLAGQLRICPILMQSGCSEN